MKNGKSVFITMLFYSFLFLFSLVEYSFKIYFCEFGMNNNCLTVVVVLTTYFRVLKVTGDHVRDVYD